MLTGYWAYNGSKGGSAGQSIEFGDNGTIHLEASNSGTQGGGGGQGLVLAEGETGLLPNGAANTQNRQLQQTIFGNNAQGLSRFEPGSRGGFSLTGNPLINDVSGTQSANDGTQKSSPVADSFNIDGGFNPNDNDGFNL